MNWPSFTVAELQAEDVLLVEDGNHGEYRPRPDEFIDGGTAFIRAADLCEGHVRFSEAGGISDVALARIRKGVGRPGDVLFSHKGTVGKLARVPHDAPPFVCSPQTTFWRVLDEARLRPDFLYAYMRSPAFIDQWWVRKGETDMADYVSLTAQRQLRVVVPPIDVQRRIAEPLAAIDDIIEGTRRRIEILEETARLIYREWFVHFRFPGHEGVKFVGSDLGPIPEGWCLESLADAAHLVMGQSPKSEFYNDEGVGLPFHQGVTNFGKRYPEHKKWCTEEKRIAEAGDILLSVRAPVGRINVAPDRLVIGRGLAALRSRCEAQVYLFESLREVFAEEDAMGGGTIFKAVTKTDLERVSLLRPPVGLIESFEAAVGPMFELVRNLTFQTRVLRRTRDLLLPQLISGELDVSDLDLDLEPVA